MPSRARAILASYPELVAVLAAAILGLSVQRPLAWLAGHQGINVLLAILVFATAVTIDPAALGRLVSAWRCPACGYVYDGAEGHPREGFPAGTAWSEVPDEWACPDCGVCDKVDFEVEVQE